MTDRFSRRHAVALATAGLLSALLFALVSIAPSRAAAAGPIGSDGMIHACYKAKGKTKGSVRLVKDGKPCKTRKRERAVAWSVGGEGPTGTGVVTNEHFFGLVRVVQEQATVIDQLTGSIGDLDGLVDGLTGTVGDLDGILAGITNADLSTVIGSLPALDALCSQLSGVTDQANALLTVIDGLGLNGVLTALGGLLQVPTLPAALSPFSCPA